VLQECMTGYGVACTVSAADASGSAGTAVLSEMATYRIVRREGQAEALTFGYIRVSRNALVGSLLLSKRKKTDDSSWPSSPTGRDRFLGNSWERHSLTFVAFRALL